jgi:hypothetical protein
MTSAGQTSVRKDRNNAIPAVRKVRGAHPLSISMSSSPGTTEFLRRFFLHVLPRGFVRIRHFGFLANRWRASRLALSRQLLSGNSPTAAETVACATSSEASSLWHCPLWRDDDRDAETYGCGIILMLLLRFFVAGTPLMAQGCALARRRTCVSASSPSPITRLSAHALAHLSRHSDHPDGIPTTPRRSPHALFRSRLPFKSHSAPRPPQTPAASS